MLSFAVAGLLGEGLVRLARPEVGLRPDPDRLLGWSSREYRAFCPEPRRSPAQARVLFLGDSFLAGYGVRSLDERFPVLFERSQANVDVEILATPGWGTDQQLLAFQQKGEAWRPDLVVLAFCANNDISNIVSNSHGPGMSKPYFVLDASGGLDLRSAEGEPIECCSFPENRPSRTRSYLFSLLSGAARRRGLFTADLDAERVDPRYRSFLQKSEPVEEIYREQARLSWSPQRIASVASAYIAEDFEMNDYQWRLFESIAGRLNAQCESVGAKLVVMLLPVTFKPQDARFIAGGAFERRFETPTEPFTFRAAEPRDRLAGVCRRLGIRFFDPTAKFIRRVTKRRLIAECWPDPDDRHFSPVAHRILAKQFGAWFESEAPRHARRRANRRSSGLSKRAIAEPPLDALE